MTVAPSKTGSAKFYRYQPQFGEFVGPWRRAFAWTPVRSFDGQLVWLRSYRRRRCQKRDYLPGPLEQWWWNDADTSPNDVYWREAYEALVRQTGRDLNDGRGVCQCGRETARRNKEPAQ